MYWNVCQQLAHHTLTGCNVRPGDLLLLADGAMELVVDSASATDVKCTVTVGGATNVAVLRDTPAAALRVLGVKNVENAMRLLPEDGRLDGERFGVCVAPMALTFDEPSEAGSLQSQVVYGEPLLLLSPLSQHTRNIEQEPRCCLTLKADEAGDVPSGATVTSSTR